MELVGKARERKARGLDMADRRRNVAVQRIHRALATGAPEQIVARQMGGGRHTIGSAGGQRERVAEQHGFRIDDRGEFAVLPQRIEFGDIEDVDRTLFQAQEIGRQFHPVDQRIGVPVDMPLRGILRRAADCRRPGHRLETNVETRIELESTQIDEAPGLHADIGEPHRLPKAHGNAGAYSAQAYRQRWVVGVRAPRGPDLETADRNRKQAGPADIGDRVHEMASTATRP